MRNLLVKAQNTILSAAFILALSSGANAVFGLVKNRLLAVYFGVSSDLAIFYTADRVPNLLYSVLVVGAFTTIFIPIFTEELNKNKQHAYNVASTMINTLFVFFLILCAISWVFAKQIIVALGVGTFNEQQINLGADILRIMLAGQLFLVAGSLAGSILQSYRLFVVPALAPIIYNIGLIAGIILWAPKFGIMGPAYGTLLGSIMHFILHIPFVRLTGFKQNLKIDLRDKIFREFIKLTPPRVLSVLLTNGLATINNSLAILISSASVVYLKFALQLQTFPVTLFGASIAAASLPLLSAENDNAGLSKFKSTFLTSFHQMMYLVLPTSAILLVLRIPVVRIVYGVSNFPWDATVNTATLLGIFAISIFPQSANYLISRAFYALKDTATPVKVSLVTIFINVALSLIFIYKLNWGVWSVAISYTLMSFFDMFILLYFLSKKTGGFIFRTISVPFLKITLAAFVMAIMLYVPIKLLDQVIFDTTKTINLLVLTAIAGISGGIAYLGLTSLLKIKEVELFYKLLRKLNIKAITLPSAEMGTPQ